MPKANKTIKYTPVAHGFQHDEIRQDDYVLGGFTKLDLKPLIATPDWKPYLPTKELQSPLFETYSCTAHGNINAIEILNKFHFENTENYSERFIATLSHTRIGGNSPHVVAEKIRHIGLVLEDNYPSTTPTSWDEYYQDVPDNLINEASDWLKKLAFKHEYVPTDNDTLFEALRSSPLGVSVAGWYEKDGMYVKPKGTRDNHWCLMVGAKYGEYWEIFDSYAPYIKKLEWDYGFEIAKRYTLQKATPKKTFWLWELLVRIFT